MPAEFDDFAAPGHVRAEGRGRFEGAALAAVHAVRAAAWWSPGRTACLEESAAVVVLLAARRLQVTWCHGVAADPVRLHAWVQTVDERPVAEPPSTRAYTPVLTLGARHQRP
ncbi:lasso peptide biosynthesis B2 protein [Streptomyces sp. NPDC002932]|uniref:lasso peptide biosynthesis B2 protein n=1 Tax=Streptomyces sp. NPDC002932 TaxID=3364672 RepID=UPI003680659C